MVRQARRRATRGRRAARERRSVALRAHLPKMFHAQRAREGGRVGGRTYAPTPLFSFLVALTANARVRLPEVWAFQSLGALAT
jgi:hypothetical protein